MTDPVVGEKYEAGTGNRFVIDATDKLNVFYHFYIPDELGQRRISLRLFMGLVDRGEFRKVDYV